jgi:hypothetical protein
MKYKITGKKCVARFYYKGSHTHPVRRTVLVTAHNRSKIIGYEVREGNIVREAAKAPIKSYSRYKIAKGADLRKDNPLRTLTPESSTLIRKPLIDIIEVGA